MSMKISQLRTYLDADDAYLIISFIGELSDVLWAAYGSDIIEQQKANQHPTGHDNRQLSLDIDETHEF